MIKLQRLLVAGSIPDVVINVSHWRNSFGRSLFLGSRLPLTGLINGLDKRGRYVGLKTLQHSCADYLKIWESEVPESPRACPGFDLPLPLTS